MEPRWSIALAFLTGIIVLVLALMASDPKPVSSSGPNPSQVRPVDSAKIPRRQQGAPANNIDKASKPPIDMSPSPRAHTIHGAVMDSDGGPLGGASVKSGDGKDTRSDSAGKFELSHGTGPVTLMISMDGFVTTLVNGSSEAKPIRVVLYRSTELHGVVRLENGTAVQGVSVSEANSRRSVETGPLGEFVLPIVKGTLPALSCGGHCDIRLDNVSESEVNIVVLGSALRILVTDDAGTPLPESHVSYKVESEGELVGGGFTKTAEDGWATLLVPPGSTVKMETSVPPFAQASGTRTLPGTPGIEEERVAMQKSRAPGAIALRVVGHQNKSVQGVRIRLSNQDGRPVGSPSTMTLKVDKDGVFRLPAVPSGPIRVKVEDITAVNWQERFHIPVTLELDVPAGAEASGECSLSLGGRLTVAFRDPEGRLLAPEDVEVIGPDGLEKDATFAYENEAGNWVDRASSPAIGWLASALRPGGYVIRGLQDPVWVASSVPG